MKIVEKKSLNFSERQLPISMLVLHYTETATDEDALKILTNANSSHPVSSHYLIGTDGTLYRLVDEEKRAWHAGLSFWRGITDVNSASIGIEISSKGRDKDGNAIPFSDNAIATLKILSKDIIRRHKIKPINIVGHSDIAPTRKIDPGELFPWKELSQNGIGLWTDKFSPPTRTAEKMLEEIGYDTTDLPAAMKSFQRHFYPEAFFDEKAEHTINRLAAIHNLIKQSP